MGKSTPKKRSGQKLDASDKQKRKQQVLTQKSPSQVQTIANGLVIKDEDLFFLCEHDGQVPQKGRHGFGLYYHDCRYLNGYAAKLGGRELQVLCGTPRKGFMAILELTNRRFQSEEGQRVDAEKLGIRWERTIDSDSVVLRESLQIQNYSQEALPVPLSLTFQAEFEDIFLVRGMLKARRGDLHEPRWESNALRFGYEGRDGVFRGLLVRFQPSPSKTEGTTAHFDLSLKPGENWELKVLLVLSETAKDQDGSSSRSVSFHAEGLEDHLDHSSDQWLGQQTAVHSDSVFLERIVDRSLRDLRVLRSRLAGQEFFAAGVPWFVTLFGRDSLISALQTLAFDPSIAEPTLRLLAKYQGSKVDDWRDEEPGKILHELRVGELAQSGVVPYTPYYGSVDATPLFLILLGRHAAWTGQLRLFHELRDPVDRALKWIDHFGDGYLVYDSKSGKGLVNQGWKDSGNAIINADGSLVEPPIALIEVQGYAYLARLSMAELFERSGDGDRARELRQKARDLRDRVNRDFWLEDKKFFALALEAGGRPAAVISSNPGQALWTGIVEPDKAERVGQRLLAADMFNGWGVRTLSSQEEPYQPIGYHLGTVWPHDNSLIAAGLRRYGLDDLADRIFTGISEAALQFPAYRMPEVFAGFRKEEFGTPVHYPVACHPQAWAAGALPFLLETILGLTPEAFEHRLRLRRPRLPRLARWIELHRLGIGPSKIDLRFERSSDGKVHVDVLHTEGPNIALEVEPEPSETSKEEAR